LESPEDFLSWLKTGKVQTAEVAEPSGPVSGSKGVLSQEAKRSIQELDRSETKRNPTNRRQIAVGIMRSLASNPEQLEAFWMERTNPGAGYVELLATDPEAINILFKSYTSSEELYQKAFEMLQALPNDETKYQFLAQLASKCFASKTLATRQMAVTVLTALDEASKGAYQVDPQLRGSFASGGIEERDPNGTEPLATLIGLINKSLEIPNEVWLTQRLLFSTKPDNRGDKIIELRGLDDIEARLIEEKGKLETFIAANKTGIHNIRARIVLGRIIRELALKQGRDPALYTQAMEQFRSAWNLYYKSMEEARESARLGKTTASIGLQTEGLQEAFTEMALTVTMARRDANKPLSKQLAAYIPDYDGREALVKKATYFESDREVRRTGGEDQITPKAFRKKADDAVGPDKGKELGIVLEAGIPIPSSPPQQGKSVASRGQAQRRDETGSRPQAGSPAALPSQAPAPTSDEADAAVRGADEALE